MGWKMVTRLALICAGAAAICGCATMPRMAYLNASPCHNTDATLYFESGDDKVGDIGTQIIALTAGRLKACHVRELRLVGLADPTGAPQDNLDLSRRRAENVLAAFQAAGLPIPKYTLVAQGARGAESPSGVVAPVRRRVVATVVATR